MSAASFLSHIFQPTDLVEIRCLRRGYDPRRWWIHPSDIDQIENKLTGLNNNGYGIYFGVNPRGFTGSDETAVLKLVAFHVDTDDDIDEAGGGFAADNPQWERLPRPSCTVESGHGKHLYWILETTVRVDDTNRELLRGINRGLAQSFKQGDPACCDLARILRLPGYINHKEPARRVKVIDLNDARYEVEEFEHLAVIRPESNGSVDTEPVLPLTPELETRFKAARYADKTKSLSRAWRGELGDGSSDSRFVLVRGLLSAGFEPGEILSIASSRRWYNRHSRQAKEQLEVERDVRGLLGKRLVPSPPVGFSAAEQPP